MSDKVTVLVLSETAAQSLVRDIGTYALIVAVIGTGWWLGSLSMQWLGFAILVMAAVNIANGKLKNRVTPQQAADRLKSEFGVVATGHEGLRNPGCKTVRRA